MAKRLTDTEKWKKPFIRSLPVEYKLFYLYLLDDCDHAGIWHVDMEVAEIRLGVKLSIQKARGFFAEKIVEFDGGTKWFVPDFIHFQYGAFNEKNKMYKAVYPVLCKYNLMEHISPIYGGKEMVMVKDKEMVKVKEWPGEKEKFLQSGDWIFKFCREKNLSVEQFDAVANEFLNDLELKEDYKDVKELRRHFTNWFNKDKKNAANRKPPAANSGKPGTSEARVHTAKNW
jgi:hypothetical protein